MAPNPLDTVDDRLKSTIHALYTLQSATHGYLGPETQGALVHNVGTLTASLQALVRAADAAAVGGTLLTPEIIEYVDSGRNPDIYTREFVEAVQRGNAYLRGKSEAVASLRDALAEEMVGAWPGMEGAVRRVLEGRGAGVEGLGGMVGDDEDGDGRGSAAGVATATETGGSR